MKILHTSDWHIGKQLHKYDLSEDLNYFFEWIVTYIKDENIDVLLISGDIFDQANPSQAAYKQYYDLLKQLINLDCKIILTGGNHDSASVLNAPKELLKTFDISVIGGATEDFSEMFVEFEKNGEKIVVAAIPFLKDRDIRKSVAGETYATKIEQIKMGLQTYFSNINAHYKNNYSDAIYILMGHLYVQGSQLSESERDIQIGNQAGIEPGIFEGVPDYVALGHIHKPQVISRTNNIHYCGSPIPLSFSEKEDCKQINVIHIQNNKIENVEVVPIPKHRNLITFQGSLEMVQENLSTFSEQTTLKSLAEIIVHEQSESIEIRQAFEELITSQSNEKIEVVKSRLIFTKLIRGATDAFVVGTDVADVTPMQMFEKKLELLSEMENTEELKNAFREILEELNL
ncbi:metallophosphoesterase family protein [Aequorivita viscosa]|uniref:Nuclease SbcCD subunit D n=1 Tax=Aequorivita viscosa TaxID=797419 RepID=A0A1M6K7B0_9FLAO|nr:exonuclease subunit SbcD [Aequorivita viscosa]SDW60655.1 Exodeoxyribonuclease I subunit D [Aequorivita viscosa]SHJ54861.1 Exodeoxyribonuclease I subunit D [Aequorivita viscosa]